MAKIGAVNAFLRGTGATFLAANLAALFALRGEHVALVDADLTAPTLHYLFGIQPGTVPATLNDFLLDRASLGEAAIDVTGRLTEPTADGGARATEETGRLHLITADDDIHMATTTLLAEYEPSQFISGFQAFIEQFKLDRLIIDTPAGTAKETLLTLALCDQLCVITTLDPREIKGSTIAVDLARALSIPGITTVLNKSGVAHDTARLRAQMQEVYECDAASVIPYADDVATLGSSGLFVCQHPFHPITAVLNEIVDAI